MDVTTALKSFQELLEATTPILIRSGIDAGDEHWDHFVETAFDIIVGRYWDTRHGHALEWRYGSWSRPGSDQPPAIRVSLVKAGSILIGDSKWSGESATIRYSELDWLNDTPLDFAFREFSHPFLQECSSERLGFVLGEVVNDHQPFIVGTRVCASLEMCRFLLEEPRGKHLSSVEDASRRQVGNSLDQTG